MVSLSLELMPGHKGSKPLSVNVLLLGLTAMIFLLHPEGFFWTAVDVIVQIILLGIRVLARIPLLFKETRVVAILLILWILALLATQKLRSARSNTLHSRSSHSRKTKRKRPAKRLSSGSIQDGPRQVARFPPADSPAQKQSVDKALEEVDQDEDDVHDSSRRRDEEPLPSSAPSFQVDNDGGQMGGKLLTEERVSQGSLETASVSSSDGSVGRSERTPPPPPPARSSSKVQQQGGGKGASPSGTPVGEKRGVGVGVGAGAWKQATVPSHPGMLSPSAGRREQQSSRSARPNKPFIDYHHHPAPSPQPPPPHKKRLGQQLSVVPRSSPSSPTLSPAPPLSPPLLKGNGPTRYVAPARPSPRNWHKQQNLYSAVTASMPPSTPTNKLPMSPPTPSSQPSRSPSFQASRQPLSHSPLLLPSWQQGQSANEERRSSHTTAWATNEQPSPRMASAMSPPPGFSSPVTSRAPRVLEPLPPGLLSVKAEPFQPSGRVLQPSTPRVVPAPLSPVPNQAQIGSFYQPQPQPQPEANASNEHSDDSHLEMSMLALSHQMSQFALGGDM